MLTFKSKDNKPTALSRFQKDARDKRSVGSATGIKAKAKNSSAFLTSESYEFHLSSMEP